MKAKIFLLTARTSTKTWQTSKVLRIALFKILKLTLTSTRTTKKKRVDQKIRSACPQILSTQMLNVKRFSRRTLNMLVRLNPSLSKSRRIQRSRSHLRMLKTRILAKDLLSTSLLTKWSVLWTKQSTKRSKKSKWLTVNKKGSCFQLTKKPSVGTPKTSGPSFRLTPEERGRRKCLTKPESSMMKLWLSKRRLLARSTKSSRRWTLTTILIKIQSENSRNEKEKSY